MRHSIACLLTLSSYWMFAQKNIMGSVNSERGYSLPGAQIYIPAKDELRTADQFGNFTINVEVGQKIRIIHPGYERLEYTIKNGDEHSPLNLQLIKLPQVIEEVKIAFQPTGDLKKDNQYFEKNTKVKKLKSEMASYMVKKSAASVYAPQPGEFVQPVGPGFSVGAVRDQWTDVDLMDFLRKELGEDYFVKDLQLKNEEIMPFVFFILKNFEKRKILKYGTCTTADLFRFQTKCSQLLPIYKNNEPLPANLKVKSKR